MVRKEIDVYTVHNHSIFNNLIYRTLDNVPRKYQKDVRISQAIKLGKLQLKNLEETLANNAVVCFPGGKDPGRVTKEKICEGEYYLPVCPDKIEAEAAAS